MKQHNRELWDALSERHVTDRRTNRRLYEDTRSATVTALGVFVFVFIAWMVASALAS
jgi:hypothetical protein